ncbi:FAD:protein FMN transferase [Oceanibium sediminis]|uniref:FAD:protein FMN transferase n=1 Tax=Oceanibium sediminis TaxID=2026339 RepID=UPI000DD46B4C|nr:FAD:protein FMN transferase [Oceanibium sediminis]
MMTSAKALSRRSTLGLIGAAFVLPLLPRTGRAAGSGLEAISGRAFGTDWRIAAPAGQDVARLAPRVNALFDRIDRQLSPWRADSAISRFNAGPDGAGSDDPAMLEVTATALEIARKSGGTFDPTVGPLVARWGFGPIEHGSAPDWRGLSLGPAGLVKARAGLTLDLCGIAKGWALDQAARLARGAGFGDLLLDVGGEFIALGQHPDGRDWRVAVDAPLNSQAAALRLPAGVAVATSGVGAQSYRLNGRLYSHIIDPGTRAPASGGVYSVSVVAGDAMTADGWATALCAAGATAGPDLAREHDIAALFLVDGSDGLQRLTTGPLDELVL